MQRLLYLLIMLGLAGTAGCAHVAANYPQIVLYTDQVLPSFHVVDEALTPLVWQEEGAVNGFLTDWRRAQSMADRYRIMAQRGIKDADQNAKIFRVMAQARMGYASIWVYTVKDVALMIESGDMQLVFLDGLPIADEGVILFPPVDEGADAVSSRDGIVWLYGLEDIGMDGRPMYVFFPQKHLKRTFLAMDYTGESAMPQPREVDQGGFGD